MLYQGGSIMVTALIWMTRQFTRENAIDCFWAHPDAAQAAGLPERLIIGAGQHQERQWALGSLSRSKFEGLAPPEPALSVSKGAACFGTSACLTPPKLDLLSLSIWLFFIAVIWQLTRLAVIIGIDVLRGWSQLPVLFMVTSANRLESILAIPLLMLGMAFFARQPRPRGWAAREACPEPCPAKSPTEGSGKRSRRGSRRDAGGEHYFR